MEKAKQSEKIQYTKALTFLIMIILKYPFSYVLLTLRFTFLL